MGTSEWALEVRELTTEFPTESGVIRAVDHLSIRIGRGEVHGLVGESGSGKSVTALSIARLIQSADGRITAGEVWLDGVQLMDLTESEMRQVRGKKIGFIFQDPMTSLNPTLTIGYQIAESARVHLGLSQHDGRARARELLERVGIPNPKNRMNDYPHQFSGGMRQRAMIAIALACQPSLLLADEPTTALDVTIQAQILELLATLAADHTMAVLLITHDLGIAAGMCDRVSVMYAGRIVESGRSEDIFANPAMPYTNGLLDCIPRVDEDSPHRLRTIDGSPPDLTLRVGGCRFADRCRYRRAECVELEPDLTKRSGREHVARCWATEPGGWIRG